MKYACDREFIEVPNIIKIDLGLTKLLQKIVQFFTHMV